MNERNEYPRPQFKRNEWMKLNGTWEFCYDDDDQGIYNSYTTGNINFDKTINVPYSYQYQASGICDPSYHPIIWYKRSFKKELNNKNALLCFNACDYETDIWINGYYVGKHFGGFTSFSFDITKYLKDDNTIVVRCSDPLDITNVRGKQSWINERFICYYVPNSGIWQSVWIEYFNKDCIKDYSIDANFDKYSLSGDITTLNGIANKVNVKVYLRDKLIKEGNFDLDTTEKNTKEYKYHLDLPKQDDYIWSCDNPTLHYVEYTLLKDNEVLDKATTRIGFKKIEIKNGNIYLNNEVLYQRLILDQGYWKESGLTPPTSESLKEDIILTKKLGFNGARKHQKYEDPYFYYYADELGLLTWCEMPSAHYFNKNEMTKVMFEWQEILKTATNFTSIIGYVPLNESWGTKNIVNDLQQQAFAKSLYFVTKAFINKDSAFISINDGWECIGETDVITIHDYESQGEKIYNKYLNIKNEVDSISPVGVKLMCNDNQYKGQPIIFSEFGGVSFATDDNGWGYSSVMNGEEYLNKYEDFITNIKKLDFTGFCYTQLTDVQQEINGVLKENRQSKVDINKFSLITRK